MREIGYAAAIVLSGLFLTAAGTKLARRHAVRRDFSAMALPGATTLSWGVPMAELALAAALLTKPRLGGALALVALAAFSAVLVRAVRLGVVTPCGCFGTARSEPVSVTELVRNGMLAILAVGALAGGRPTLPSLEAVMAVTLAVATGAMVLALVDLGRQLGGAFDNSRAMELRARP